MSGTGVAEPYFTHADCHVVSILECAVCCGFPKDPVVTPCHHIFCRACISQVSQCRSECPHDRNTLHLCQLKDVDGVLKRIWAQTPVKCPKCLWSGDFDSYLNHAVSCSASQENNLPSEAQRTVSELLLRENELTDRIEELERLIVVLRLEHMEQIETLETQLNASNEAETKLNEKLLLSEAKVSLSTSASKKMKSEIRALNKENARHVERVNALEIECSELKNQLCMSEATAHEKIQKLQNELNDSVASLSASKLELKTLMQNYVASAQRYQKNIQELKEKQVSGMSKRLGNFWKQIEEAVVKKAKVYNDEKVNGKVGNFLVTAFWLSILKYISHWSIGYFLLLLAFCVCDKEPSSKECNDKKISGNGEHIAVIAFWLYVLRYVSYWSIASVALLFAQS